MLPKAALEELGQALIMPATGALNNKTAVIVVLHAAYQLQLVCCQWMPPSACVMQRVLSQEGVLEAFTKRSSS